MAGDHLLGYFVAMLGVDEAHLLNITVAPAYQRQGWARVLLDALACGHADAGRSGCGGKCAPATCAPSRCMRPMASGAWANANATTRQGTGSAKTPWS